MVDADELFSRCFSKASQTAAGKPLHRIIVPPPIPVGGAFYAVTHSQRKYHHTRMWFLAHSFAKAACGIGGVRSIPLNTSFQRGYPGAPAARLNTYGTCLMALFSCKWAVSSRRNAPFPHNALLPTETSVGKVIRWIGGPEACNGGEERELRRATQIIVHTGISISILVYYRC